MSNSIVRSILFWIVFIALLFTLGSTLMPIVQGRWSRFSDGILGTLTALFCIWIFVKWDKTSFANLGLVWENKTLLRFIIGLILGTIILGIVYIALVGFTALQVSMNPKGIDMATAIGYFAFIPLALGEELAFRSYPLVTMNRKYGLWITQCIVAIAFAVYHMFMGWSAFSAFSGPFVWAFVFGLAAVWSGGIALPTGIHCALNVLQGITGMKGAEYSLLTLSYKDGIADNLITKTETVGIIIQITILLLASTAMIFYIRKTSKKKALSPDPV